MARRSWDDPWRRYAESKPLPADGIATSKQRGAMAEHWWSKRLVEVLDDYGLGTRMQRGRRYARSGQVLTIDVTPGLLSAQVQGSRRTPYMVTVRSAPGSDDAWAAVEAALRGQVGLVARLMAGEVPSELEAIAADAGMALFPGRWRDLTARCSCPDWESPCKHLAAVLYVYADQLDDDPWLLLTWRGRSRAELLAHLESVGSGPGDGFPSWWPLRPSSTAQPAGRWRPPSSTAPESAAAVLARLAPLDAAVLGRPIAEVIAQAYPTLAEEQ